MYYVVCNSHLSFISYDFCCLFFFFVLFKIEFQFFHHQFFVVFFVVILVLSKFSMITQCSYLIANKIYNSKKRKAKRMANGKPSSFHFRFQRNSMCSKLVTNVGCGETLNLYHSRCTGCTGIVTNRIDMNENTDNFIIPLNSSQKYQRTHR